MLVSLRSCKLQGKLTPAQCGVLLGLVVSSAQAFFNQFGHVCVCGWCDEASLVGVGVSRYVPIPLARCSHSMSRVIMLMHVLDRPHRQGIVCQGRCGEHVLSPGPPGPLDRPL